MTASSASSAAETIFSVPAAALTWTSWTPSSFDTSPRTDASQCPQLIPVTVYSASAMISPPWIVGDTPQGYPVAPVYTREGYGRPAPDPESVPAQRANRLTSYPQRANPASVQNYGP